MRGLLIVGLLTLAFGCGKKTEPITPPTGWSVPPAGAKPTGSKVD